MTGYVLAFGGAVVAVLTGLLALQTARLDATQIDLRDKEAELAACNATSAETIREKNREDAIADTPFDDLLDPDWLLLSPDEP